MYIFCTIVYRSTWFLKFTGQMMYHDVIITMVTTVSLKASQGVWYLFIMHHCHTHRADLTMNEISIQVKVRWSPTSPFSEAKNLTLSSKHSHVKYKNPRRCVQILIVSFVQANRLKKAMINFIIIILYAKLL